MYLYTVFICHCRYPNPQSFVMNTPTTPGQDPSIEDQVTSAGTGLAEHVHCT